MDVAASGSPSSPAAPPISSSPTTAFTPDAEVDNFRRSTSSPSTEGVYSTRDPSQVSAQTFDSAVNWSAGPSSIAGCTYIDASECSSAFSATNGSNIAYATKSSLLMSLSPTEPCTPFPSDKAVTEYSIVYTSTITFYGNTSDYTPPYSPITTPNYCSPPGEALITFFSTSRITNSTATLTVPATSSASPSYGLMIPGPAPTFSIDLPEIITQTADAAGKHGGGVATTMRPFLSFTRHVITFITTDKNPSVVFSPEVTPSFSQTLITGGLVDGNHETIQPTDGPQTNTRISDPLESVKQSPVPTFRLTAGGDQVIINDKTVSGLKPGQTTTITVGTEAFTILPTAVVGLGSTITKPAPQEAATPPMPTATSRVLGGASVVISGSQVVVDGTTLGVSPQQATTTVNGKEVVLGTGAVVVDGETLIFRDHPPRPTDEIVAGGEMLTAIGNSVVVVRSATITYGPRIAPYETTVNGEVISIGPRGVSLHGTTIGGPLANATDTEYEIVGGVTVGKLLPSLVVVNGVTYSVNQDGDPNNAETTVIDNQTITIGPSGLIMSSQTLTYPGASVTATLSPPGTPMPDIPAETGTRDGRGGDGDSGASSAHLGAHVGGVMCICLAISVWVMS
ncbi:hypothetical protein Trco_004098 [Trichoderma cornu-damae]|uniref:Uncharacterized protein n=1 Tax=Trichoderma cornu-damae TaxID=654480 RepID=A0A9P8QQF3_9HYPO|nr:hypothetical protein Trco_004098 [Trichoderma cornu-damae]